MIISSTDEISPNFWEDTAFLKINNRINAVEAQISALNINVVSNDADIRESISSLQNSYNEQIISNLVNANQANVNYFDGRFVNVDNIFANNINVENLTVNRPVFDLTLNTAHLENTTSLDGNFFTPNLNNPKVQGHLQLEISDTPVISSAVLGYDEHGNVIPIKAVYDIGLPENADYLYTDEFGTAFAAISAPRVMEGRNLIQAGAVQNMYNEINDTFSDFHNDINNSFNDVNNIFNDVNNTFNDVNNFVNNSLNDVNNTFNDVNNSVNDVYNDINNTFNDVNNYIDDQDNNITNDVNILRDQINTLQDLINSLSTEPSHFDSETPINYQGVTVVHWPGNASGGTTLTGVQLKYTGTTLNIDNVVGSKLPGPITNCVSMFYNCRSLNQNIQIPNHAVKCDDMFRHCDALNQNILIPDSVTDCTYMFGFCALLNQNISIPASVTNVEGMFHACSNLNQNIYMYATPTGSMENMFTSCTKLADKYIHIPASVPLETSNSIYNALVNNFTKVNWSGRVLNDL